METLLPYVPIIGWSAVGVLVVMWLIVSFTAPSARRATFEWLGAVSLYVALLSLFVNLLAGSLADDSWLGTLGVVGFGFLATMFTLGLGLSLVQLLASLRGPEKTVSSATN